MSIPSASTEIEWLELSLGLLGGMVLFIFSVTLLSEGLKAAGGHQVKTGSHASLPTASAASLPEQRRLPW
jgi:hypothetical protein